jgi:MoxR-like ATPase
MPSIQFTKGPFIDKSYTLDDSGLTIGRTADCDIRLEDDTKISGTHAEIRPAEDAWWVFDLDSSNGTKLNGRQIESSALSVGDYVSIGESAFQFLEQNAADEENEDAQDEFHKIDEDEAGEDAKVSLEEGDDTALVAELNDAYAKMKAELGQVIVGQEEVIEQMLIAIFCRGHALLIGVPGLAKTLLVSTLSKVLDLSFKRVQFTPDLMPTDITGTEVLEEDQVTGARSFRFVKGPLFANMVLADEINRTPPKTQAALLEAMQEHHITVGDTTYDLPEPFFVLATQNPIEQEGTYPLPEAQLDRFMFNIIVGYPSADEEERIIKQVTGTYKAVIETSLDGDDVLKLQEVVRRVPVADHVVGFASDLARASRPKEDDAPDFVREMVGWGAGPRAGINLITAAKARAVLQGRYHATTADVKAVALPVLRHRIITTFNAEAAGVSSDDIVRMLLKHVKAARSVDI